ncbi:50S ribosomal protein L3p (L3e) [Candidatus Nasuia deltocephalinicola]|nr:50S ribosomal protein L3p (L3e) [Candidatus Nasuia deltocephalinicola]
MSLGLIGKKIGMSRLYNIKGHYIPVTLINVFNNYVVQIKKNINFNSFQLSFCFKNIFNLNNSLFNHFFKYNVYFYGIIKEFKVNNYDFNRFFSGDLIPINIFYINQNINIFGKSIGKGFSGVIKRFNFKSGPSTHGSSKFHNSSGSIGMSQDPGRVFLGKKMAGHLGFKNFFIKNLKILKIDFSNNIIFVKGSVIGCTNSYITIIPSDF